MTVANNTAEVASDVPSKKAAAGVTRRDDAVHDGHIGGWHEFACAGEGVPVSVEAFGVFAHDDQVCAFDDGVAAGEGLAGRMLAKRPKCLRMVPDGFSADLCGSG